MAKLAAATPGKQEQLNIGQIHEPSWVSRRGMRTRGQLGHQLEKEKQLLHPGQLQTESLGRDLKWETSNFPGGLRPCSREKVLLCAEKRGKGFSIYSVNEDEAKGKCLKLGQMRLVDWAVAEHLLSPFSSPFFRVKWLYDYGFWTLDSFKNAVGSNAVAWGQLGHHQLLQLWQLQSP